MAYKVFLAPTGSGNTIIEGELINARTSPDGKQVHLQFFSNFKRSANTTFNATSYAAALYLTDHQGAKSLRDELESLLRAHAEQSSTFHASSDQGNFELTRELEGAPLNLIFNGTDKLQGRSFHRGDSEAMEVLLKEFEQVLQTIDDVVSGKGPSE